MNESFSVIMFSGLLTACGVMGAGMYWDIRKRVDRVSVANGRGERRQRVVLVVLLRLLDVGNPQHTEFITQVTRELQNGE